jgi:hypothetical protein
MTTKIQKTENGTYAVTFDDLPIVEVRTAQQARVVRDFACQVPNLIYLSEFAPRDLVELSGYDRSQCASERPGRRLGLAWGRNAEDAWIVTYKPTLIVEHDESSISDIEDQV